MSSTFSRPTGPLSDKAAIKRLLADAQRALGVTTVIQLADAMGVKKPGTFYQQVRRGSLSVAFQMDLLEIIRTGRPLARVSHSEQLLECRKWLDETYQALGPKGRAQFMLNLSDWLSKQKLQLRRLDPPEIGLASRRA